MAQLNSHSSIFKNKPRTLDDVRADLKDLATVNENYITVLSHEGLILQLKNALENYQYAAIWHMAHVTPMV